MPRFFLTVGLVVVLIPLRTFASPLDYSLEPVGQADLKVFWFDIYRAELFSDTGTFSGIKAPLYLKITYKRNIAKRALLEETRKQIAPLVDPSMLALWINKLKILWPDISKRDSLSFYLSEPGSGHFYHNDNYLGSIEDGQFGRLFLGIWLGKNSSFPRLTKQLIGED